MKKQITPLIYLFTIILLNYPFQLERAVFTNIPRLECRVVNVRRPNCQVLTEVCDNGSIFDLYSKQNVTFKRSTAWRLARECAGIFRKLEFK